MSDLITQFCFFCEKETTFKYHIKITSKLRSEGFFCVECKGGATCDKGLRAMIEARQARNLSKTSQPTRTNDATSITNGPGGD